MTMPRRFISATRSTPNWLRPTSWRSVAAGSHQIQIVVGDLDGPDPEPVEDFHQIQIVLDGGGVLENRR